MNLSMSVRWAAGFALGKVFPDLQPRPGTHVCRCEGAFRTRARGTGSHPVTRRPSRSTPRQRRLIRGNGMSARHTTVRGALRGRLRMIPGTSAAVAALGIGGAVVAQAAQTRPSPAPAKPVPTRAEPKPVPTRAEPKPVPTRADVGRAGLRPSAPPSTYVSRRFPAIRGLFGGTATVLGFAAAVVCLLLLVGALVTGHGYGWWYEPVRPARPPVPAPGTPSPASPRPPSPVPPSRQLRSPSSPASRSPRHGRELPGPVPPVPPARPPAPPPPLPMARARHLTVSAPHPPRPAPESPPAPPATYIKRTERGRAHQSIMAEYL
jgi:hypothetical protein